jgi:hypothetical protein
MDEKEKETNRKNGTQAKIRESHFGAISKRVSQNCSGISFFSSEQTVQLPLSTNKNNFSIK